MPLITIEARESQMPEIYKKYRVVDAKPDSIKLRPATHKTPIADLLASLKPLAQAFHLDSRGWILCDTPTALWLTMEQLLPVDGAVMIDVLMNHNFKGTVTDAQRERNRLISYWRWQTFCALGLQE